jgi:hypothetical protein
VLNGISNEILSRDWQLASIVSTFERVLSFCLSSEANDSAICATQIETWKSNLSFFRQQSLQSSVSSILSNWALKASPETIEMPAASGKALKTSKFSTASEETKSKFEWQSFEMWRKIGVSFQKVNVLLPFISTFGSIGVSALPAFSKPVHVQLFSQPSATLKDEDIDFVELSKLQDPVAFDVAHLLRIGSSRNVPLSAPTIAQPVSSVVEMSSVSSDSSITTTDTQILDVMSKDCERSYWKFLQDEGKDGSDYISESTSQTYVFHIQAAGLLDYSGCEVSSLDPLSIWYCAIFCLFKAFRKNH